MVDVLSLVMSLESCPGNTEEKEEEEQEEQEEESKHTWEINNVFYFIERANSGVWSLHSLCIHSEEPGLLFFRPLRSCDAFYIFYFLRHK